MEGLAGTPAQRHAEFRKALRDKNPVVAANAAIELARLGDGSGLPQLAQAIRSANLKLEMRCAAAEALGEIREPSPRSLIGELIDQYGKDSPDGGSRIIPELHAELTRSLARHVDPADDRRLTEALKSLSPAVRLEAINAWAAGRRGALPVEATDLRTDPDLRVRSAALRAFALRRDPQAHEYLATALNDTQLQVRLAAIAGLGLLGGPEAKASLSKVKKDEAELIRAEAVMSLSRLGETSAVLDSAADRSWRVRLAVAQSLTACPSAASRTAARKLLGDASSEVQRATVLAIAGWPLPQSGPLLLEALASNCYTTRRTAARELVRLWPTAAGFPIDGPAPRRATCIEQLGRRFREEFGAEELAATGESRRPLAPAATPAFPEPERIAATAGEQGDKNRVIDVRETPPHPGPLPEGEGGKVSVRADTLPEGQGSTTVARVDQCLERLADARSSPTDRQAAIDSLVAVGPALVAVLEQRTDARRVPLPEAVYREVLPRQNPVYAALDRLASGSLTERRLAAGELADSVRHKPLGRLATDRLAAVSVKQQDALVWQGVLAAVENNAGPGAVQLAYAAIGHAAPEVRRRACQYLASHPDPRHVAVLLPALGDSSEQVVTAAVRAIGAAGKLDDLQPVRRLLTASDETQRLEAAGALARLGDPTGLAALERLSYSDNPSTRQRTAELMGQLGSEACLASLIRLLDDNWQNVRLAALKSLPNVASQDVARTEGEWSVTAAQRITLWKQWYQQRAK